MKIMAGLAMLIGAFQGFSIMGEVMAVNFMRRGTVEQVGLTLVVLSSVFLIVAGVALWRRSRGAAGLARVAGAATIASFAFVGLTVPMLSVLSMLLGTVFPAGMLVYLLMSRGQSPSSPIPS